MSSHVLLNLLDTEFLKYGNIIEIGSSRERARSATTSTYYFRDLTRKIDTKFFSVDFAEQSYVLAKDILVRDRAHCSAWCSDGAQFIEEYKAKFNEPIALLYLDNFDVIYNEAHAVGLLARASKDYEQAGEEITNQRSAEVHLEQMLAALPAMAKRSVVICDDTLVQDGKWWGKCAYVVPALLKRGWKLAATNENGCMLVSPKFYSPWAKRADERNSR